VVLKGPITIPPGASPKVDVAGRQFTSANQALRKLFGLFANVRPSRSLPGVPSRYDSVDLVVIRENTEVPLPPSSGPVRPPVPQPSSRTYTRARSAG
jgi:isocitrate/isopropylmalate dehydrogenase